MRAKILIVDDRDDNLLSIETILGDEEYYFVKANSGRNALKILLNEFDFALILMDVKMPNLDGFETAELIYEQLDYADKPNVRKRLRKRPPSQVFTPLRY